MVETEFAPLPFILVLNKSDLTEEIKISEADQTQIAIQNIAILTTSAKNGDNVDNAFRQLSEMMI
jgi:50S ribosomal subunit-associated GTPase HflX